LQIVSFHAPERLCARIDRGSDHLAPIAGPEIGGAFFRLLLDPADIAPLQGKFTLQVLGSAAKFERAQIRYRAKEELASART